MGATMSSATPESSHDLKGIFTIGTIFAFYVFAEGVLSGYELLTGHHLEITENSNVLTAIGILGNLLFGGHFLYSAWESRRLTLLTIAVALILAAGYGIYIWTKGLPESGRKWIETVEQLPSGTVFLDPYSNKLRIKDGLGIHPYPSPLDDRKNDCLTPSLATGC